MNLDLLNNIPDTQPFVQTDRLTAYVLRSTDGSIVEGFRVILDGEEKTFKIRPPSKKGNNEILEAWIEMEKYTGKLL